MSDLIDRGDVLGVISCFFEDSFIEDADVHCAELEREINRLPAAPRWVRCEEALPEIGQRVIVYDGWMQFMTRKDDQRLNGKMYWENEEGNWERVDDEAYWMPIEPPKEGSDGN